MQISAIAVPSQPSTSNGAKASPGNKAKNGGKETPSKATESVKKLENNVTMLRNEVASCNSKTDKAVNQVVTGSDKLKKQLETRTQKLEAKVDSVSDRVSVLEASFASENPFDKIITSP